MRLVRGLRMKVELSLCLPVSTSVVYPIGVLPRPSGVGPFLISVPLSQLRSTFASHLLWLIFRGLSLCQLLEYKQWRSFTNDCVSWFLCPRWYDSETESAMQCSPLASGLCLKLQSCLSPSSSLSCCPQSVTGFSWELLLHEVLVHYSHPKTRELDLGQVTKD